MTITAPPASRMLQFSGGGTWTWDIASDTLVADVEFAELYGLDPVMAAAGLPARTFFKAIHPEDVTRIRIAVAGILAGAELFSKEFRIVAPDGAIVWVHARGQGHHDDNDETASFSGLLVDVTERKRAEERLRIAQSAGGVGTFEYVDGFATVDVSEEFCRLLGFHGASKLPVQTINSVVAEGDLALIPDGRNSELPEKLDAVFRVNRGDDGADRWIARRGEIQREGSGYRLIGVIYDVTAAKEQEAALRELNETLETRVLEEVVSRQTTEDALRQAQKMEAVGQLTGGIAHDFNNLLMAISSSLALLSKRVPSDEKSQRLIDGALEATERGAALTQRMLAFARRQDLKPEPLDIRLVADGMNSLLEHTLGPMWSLTIDLPDDLPLVVADANQLEMAILNLVVNARDATPGGGEIAIRGAERAVSPGEVRDLAPGNYLSLSVVDSGIGMDTETLARATEPFFTTKGVGKGTGLGLSMIHGLASQLGGTFALTSTPGEGTTATLLLPSVRGDLSPLESEAVVVTNPTISRLKILAVDDDFLILMNTTALLEDMGHEVHEARSGEEALSLLTDNDDFDLLMTDQAMPNMTGLQLVERLAAIRPNLPVILASGYGEIPVGTETPMFKLGKPYSQEQLASALGQALELGRVAARTH